jgi:dienelactone hydrolase
MKRLRSLPLLSIVFLFSLAFATPIATFAQDSYLPEPTGPYIIGTTTRHWIDESREETYAGRDPSRGEFRELMVQIWYPGEIPLNVRMRPVSYFLYPEVQLQLFNDLFTLAEIGYAMPLEFVASPTHAYLDIPVAATEPEYPVIIFSPGLIAPPSWYQTQFEELASHGYIVVGIFHTYTTPGTVFPDGTTIIPTAVFDIPSTVWSADQRFVLDELERLQEDDDGGLFTGRFDLNRVGVYGHSYGADATVYTMINDERFKAGISMDGNTPLEVPSERPMINLMNREIPYDGRLRRLLEVPVYLSAFRFDNFWHASFSDCVLSPGNETIVHLGVICEMEDPLRAIEVANAYIRGFFDKHLKGEDVPLLDGPSDEYPEVEYFTAER